MQWSTTTMYICISRNNNSTGTECYAHTARTRNRKNISP